MIAGLYPNSQLAITQSRLAKLSGGARDTSSAAVNYGIISGMSLGSTSVLRYCEPKVRVIGKVAERAYYENYRSRCKFDGTNIAMFIDNYSDKRRMYPRARGNIKDIQSRRF